MLDYVVKPSKHDTDRIVWVRTLRLGTHTSHDKRTTPISFQSQGGQGHMLDIVVKPCKHNKD